MDMDDLIHLRKKLDAFVAEHAYYKKQREEEEKILQEEKQRLENTLEARKIAQEVAERLQQECSREIAGLVSKCLQAIFDDPYEFKIQFSQKRGKTEAEMVFLRNGKGMDPLSSTGGGVVDVAGFALRLANLILSTPKKRKLLILDEPMKMLSNEYSLIVGDLLVSLCKELDMQIIMVTHNQELMAGKVIKL